LNKSRTKISATLNIPFTQTFVPPYNAWNKHTETALLANNFTSFSSQTDMDLPPYNLSPGQSLYHFPIYASTSDNEIEAKSGAYVGVAWQRTYNDIITQLGQYGFAAGEYFRLVQQYWRFYRKPNIDI
jgi:hypothetical protein